MCMSIKNCYVAQVSMANSQQVIRVGMDLHHETCIMKTDIIGKK